MLSKRPDHPSRQDQKAATRAALLDAARAVLAERGLASTTTRAIADRAGVAAGTFFVHFADVAALVDALLDDHIDRAIERGKRSLPAGSTLADELVHMSTSLFASYERERDLSMAFLSSSLFRLDPDSVAAQRLAVFRGWVTERIEAAVQRGEIPSTDADLVFDAYFCTYFGLLVGGLAGQMSRRRQAVLLREVLDRLLHTARVPA